MVPTRGTTLDESTPAATEAAGFGWANPSTLATQQAQINSGVAYPDVSALPHYLVTATLDPPDLSGSIQLSFRNEWSQPVNDVVLRLYSNARTIYTGARMTIADARVGGKQVPTREEADGTAARLLLDDPLLTGDAVTVSFDFHTRIPVGSAGGYGIQQVSGDRAIFGTPFPLLALRDETGWRVSEVPRVGDAVSSPAALWDIFLDVPSGTTVVSSGQTIAHNGNQLHIVTGPARDVAIVTLPDRTEPIEEHVAGTTLRYWPAPEGSRATLLEAVVIAAGAIEAFSAEFGQPPYVELDVVEAAVPIGGYEYPGLVLFDVAERAAGDRAAMEFLIPHEVAHQWFYALVGNDVTQAPWIDEGFATYAQLRYLAHRYGEDAARAQRTRWEQEYATVLARNPVGIDATLYQYDNWIDYRGPAYYAAALLLDDLRQAIGERRFREAVQRLLDQFAFREADTVDVLRVFDNVAADGNINLEEYWTRWFTTYESP